MKKIITAIIIICAISFSYAQNIKIDSIQANDSIFKKQVSVKSSTTKADKLFKQMWYKESASLYEAKLHQLEKNKKSFSQERNKDYLRILKKAGDSYFFNTDMKNAAIWYEKLVSNFYSTVNSEYLFRYAHSLQGIGKYREAKRWMKEFSKKVKKEDDRSLNFNQQEITVEDILNIEPKFMLKNLSINTENSDFGAMYYKDKLIYSSAIDTSNYHTRVYHWNEQPFLNMFISTPNEIESDVYKNGEFSENLNTRYHEATLAFTPNHKKVYFTRNNYDGKLGRDDNGTNHLKLYTADLITSEKDSTQNWKNVKELPFNSENYSVGHPTISTDGKLLYFVSDMPGSIGSTDIFVVDIIEGYEEEKDSSYVKYSKPRNLGEKINTAGREMFPYITDNNLYFASDGLLGLGGLDVFQSEITENIFQNPINLGAPLNSKMDDFSFIIKEAKNTGYVSSNRLSGKGDDDIYSFVRTPPIEKLIPLPIIKEELPLCEQSINGHVSNTITGERISNVKMVLFDEKGNQLEKTITNIGGAYRFNTTLNCDTKYRVEASKTGYGLKVKPVITEKENGETIVELGLKTLNRLIVEEGGVLKIKIDIIYFDLNKSFIRNDAGIELNKILVLMLEYPEMVIKIESHTDARGSDRSNFSLSDRRAKSTRDYLISKGIGANRIESANGYGETRLINHCSNGVRCSETEHQFNRRSEFIIVKM
ncbi:OmpA family protein [Tenacibaculum aestuariivivum]|uniref:OmpA family protein n=1 Tax=Tenacibaculum aestuariivivum TaxID=2006131 RepID=UPI003AB1BEC0